VGLRVLTAAVELANASDPYGRPTQRTLCQVRLEKGWRNFYALPTDLSCGIRRISVVVIAFSYPSSNVERQCRSAQSASVGQKTQGRKAMFAVKGTCHHGVAHPAEPIAGRHGQAVIMTFLEEEHLSTQPTQNATGWDALHQLVADGVVETGMNDLAQQHAHDLYGKPQQE